MSISSGSFSFCSSASCSEEIQQDSPTVQYGWLNELDKRIHVFDDKVDTFLDTLVPSSIPYPLEELTATYARPFSAYKPEAGKEVLSYPSLISGLENLVSHFPESKKLSFVNTHGHVFPFPFSGFVRYHHESKPDIAVSFPGENLNIEMTKAFHWHRVSFVIEVKPTREQDPFPVWKSSKKGNLHIVQVARNARNLLLTHGFLATFVVGIYAGHVRIARFDHTCAVVSRAFDLKRRPDLLQRFFWHFVHPRVGHTVVGCDPTVRRLDESDVEWLKQKLQAAGECFDDKDIDECRRTCVYDERSGTDTWYIAYKLIDVNTRLFSRATSVWRVIEDTRDPTKDGNVVEVPEVRILKESWRQVVRQSEATFYHRLEQCIEEKDWYGLAKLERGGDLGQHEVALWEKSSPNVGCMPKGQRELRLPSDVHTRPTPPSSDLVDNTHAPSSGKEGFDTPSDTPSSPLTSFPSSPTPVHADGEDVLEHNAGTPNLSEHSSRAPLGGFPLPYPQHQTFSWTIACGPDYTYRERSHMRFVMKDVGRPLTEFKNTKELVMAVRDAIRGHKLAWLSGGVLHRDISLGNILIVDQPDGRPFVGFIHDFDYSSMSEDLVFSDLDVPAFDDESKLAAFLADEDLRSTNTLNGMSGSGQPTKDEDDNANINRKERTGTYYFIAMQLLSSLYNGVHDVRHDLESFYWVLLWVVLRHTKHDLGQERCKDIFVYGDDYLAQQRKLAWISDFSRTVGEQKSNLILFNGNKPLTVLLHEYRKLVRAGAEAPEARSLTYDLVLALFDQALEKTGWPKNDRVQCGLLNEAKTHSLVANIARPKGKQRQDDLPKASSASVLASVQVDTKGAWVSAPATHRSYKRKYEVAPEDEHRNAEAEGPVAGPSRRSQSKRAKVDLQTIAPPLQAARQVRRSSRLSGMPPPPLPRGAGHTG